MKKLNSVQAKAGELRAEYDFGSMSGGVRGKYHRRFKKGVNVALLEPEVAKAFPTDEAVNDALRTVLRAAKALRRPQKLSNKRIQQTNGAKSSRGRAARS